MKVIDLLNKIANEEYLPDKIKIECVNSINEHNCYYHFSPIFESYINDDNTLIQNATNLATLLDLEIEIIEENKNIKDKRLVSNDVLKDMKEIKLKVEYNDDSAYITFDGKNYNLFLNKRDYEYFTIKDIIYEPVDTYVIIEVNTISIYYGEYMKFKKQEHMLDTIKGLANTYDIDYLAETGEHNLVLFLDALSDITKED